MEAFLAVKDVVERENIACHYKQQGRLLLATSSRMYDDMAREFALREKHLGEPFQTVSRAEQRDEIATRPLFRRRAHCGPCGAASRPLSPGPARCGARGGRHHLRLHAGARLPQGGGGLHGVREGRQGRGARAGLRHQWLWRAGVSLAAAAHHAVPCLSGGDRTDEREPGAGAAAGRPHLHRLELQRRLDAASRRATTRASPSAG